MDNIPDRKSILIRARSWYDRTKLLAQHWQLMCQSGVAVTRDIQQAVEPTNEERADGRVVSWEPLSDKKKCSNALNTALTHIRHLEIIAEIIIALEEDDPVAYKDAQERFYLT